MLTLADLHYLLCLVKVDYWDGENAARSERVEGKLIEIIGEVKGGDRGMGKTSKAPPKKKAAAKPVGKTTKRK